MAKNRGERSRNKRSERREHTQKATTQNAKPGTQNWLRPNSRARSEAALTADMIV